MKRSIQKRRFSQQVMTTLRTRLRLPVNLLMLFSTFSWTVQSHALVLIKTNAGPNTFLGVPVLSPGAPSVTNAQNLTPSAVDTLLFGGQITGTTTLPTNFRVANGIGAELILAGLKFTNPGSAIVIQNNDSQNQTLKLGASGIDMSQATQNVTFSNSTVGGTLSVATTAAQAWTVANGRTLTVSAPLSLTGQLDLQFVGGNSGGTAGAINLTGAISGTGPLNIVGMIGGAGGTVTMGAANTLSGAVTVGGGAELILDQTAANQDKLANGQILTLNRGSVTLSGTGGGTEVVAGVALGQGFNQVRRGSGTGVLQMGAISRSTIGAGLNFKSDSPGFVTTTNANTSTGTLGAWALYNFSDWATVTAGSVGAYTGYTVQANPNAWSNPAQNIRMDASGTAPLGQDRTIASLKFASATASLNLGNFKLTINDGANGGGILRYQAPATLIEGGSITAGASDAIADSLYIWNSLSTMTIRSAIVDNGAAALHLFFGSEGALGFLQLEGVNTYTGTTTIAGGTLTLGGNSAGSDTATLGGGAITNFGSLVINKTSSATTALANSISGTGNLTINRGTLTLSGSNTYTGDTVVSASAILNANSASALSGTSRMVLNAASARLNLVGANGSVAALQGLQSSATVDMGGNTLTLTGSDLARSGTANLLLSQVPQVYQGAIIGSGGLVKNGNYTQVLSGAGLLSYTGSTNVNAGTLQVNKSMATNALTIGAGSFIADLGAELPNVTSVTIGAGGSLIANAADLIANGASVNLTGAGALWQMANGAGDTVASLSGVTDTQVTLGAGAGATTLTVNDNGSSATTFNGVITTGPSSVGLGNVVKNGSNTWILGGGNSYNGATTINGGVVQVASSALVQVLPDSTALTLANTAGVALDLNGHNETIGSLAGGGTGGGNVTMGVGTLTTGGNGSSTSFGGVISGSGGLVKVGAGNFTLTGINTFVGPVSITGGTLTLDNASGALPNTAEVNISGAGATLNVSKNQTVTTLTSSRNSIINVGAGAALTSTAGDAGTIVRTSSFHTATRVVRITAAAGTDGLVPGMPVSGTNIQAGTYIVQILNQSQILISRVPGGNSIANQELTYTRVNQIAAALTGEGNWTKNGTGVTILSGASTLSGTITINDGIVQAGGVNLGGRNIIQDVLSNNATFNFGSTGSPTLNFASSGNYASIVKTGTNVPELNLLPFERIGGLSGGSAAAVINLNTSVLTNANGLTDAASSGILAVGSNNRDTEFTGSIFGGASANGTTTTAIGIGATTASRTAWFIKEGTGTLKWNNDSVESINGVMRIDGGKLIMAGAQGLDVDSYVSMSNQAGATLTLATTALGGERIDFLIGGAFGSSRLFPNGVTGALMGNYLNSTGGAIVLETSLTLGNSAINAMSLASPIINAAIPIVYTYGGILSGGDTANGLFKEGNSTLELRGVSTYMGDTTIQNFVDNTTSVIRLGAYGASAGVGNPLASGGFGALPETTNLRLRAGDTGLAARNVTFELNGASQTVNSLTSGNSNGAKTFSLSNGTLTVNTARTGTTSGIFDGTFSGRGIVTVLATRDVNGRGWELTGNSNTSQTGDFNILGGRVTSNVNGGSIGDTVNVKIDGAGMLSVLFSDTVGSLSGTGSLFLADREVPDDNEETGVRMEPQELRLTRGVPGTGTFSTWSGSSSGPGGLALLEGSSLRIMSNQGYTGPTSVSGGASLWLDYTANATNILSNTGGLNLNGGTIVLNGNGQVEVVGFTNIGAGASLIASQSNSSGGSARLNLGTINRDVATGGVLQIKGASASTTGVTIRDASTNPLGIMGGWAIFGNGAYAESWAVAKGSGSPIDGLPDSGYTTTGWGEAFNSDVLSGTRFAEGATGSIRFKRAGATTLKVGGQESGLIETAVRSGGILVTRNVGASNVIITSVYETGEEKIFGSFNDPYGSVDQLMIHQFNPLGSLTLNLSFEEYGVPVGVNGERTKGQLIKTGPGRLILTQSNSYNGQTSILGGVLQLGDLNNFTFGGNGTLGGSSAPVLNNGYLSIQRSDEFLQILNDITGTGTLRIEGPGIVDIGGINSTYTGATSVLQGTLRVVTSNRGLGSTDGLTTVASGARLSLAGLTTPETIVLQGGTLEAEGINATTSGLVLLTGNSFLSSASGASLTLAGPIIAYPNMQNVSTITIKGTLPTIFGNLNNSIGNIAIESGATLQIGNNSAGSMGRGSVLNNGTIIINTNDTFSLFGSAISGSGDLRVIRNNVYLTGKNTYTGKTLIGNLTVPATADLRIGNDTYDSAIGKGEIILQSTHVQNVGSGTASLRFHLIGDTVLSNPIIINPYTNGSVAAPGVGGALNAVLYRQGLGNVELSGLITAGFHDRGPSGTVAGATGGDQTQRAILQSEGGGKLILSGPISNGNINRLNVINNGAIDITGTHSNTYWGVLSGGGVWAFSTTGTTTLKGINTTNSGNIIIQRGTLVVDNAPDAPGGIGAGLENSSDQYVLRGATLQFNYNELIGGLYTEKGSTILLGKPNEANPTAITLTIDDNINHGIFGKITDTYALNPATGVKSTVRFDADLGAAWYGLLGVSDFGGDPIIGSTSQTTTVRVSQLANAGLPSSLGSGSEINLGVATSTQEARWEYFGTGDQSMDRKFNLGGAAATARISANSNGTVNLNGDVRITGAGNKTLVLGSQSTMGNFINGILDEASSIMTLQVNPYVNGGTANTANDDRYGAGKWTLTNAANNFSGNVTIGVGALELKGDLKTGSTNAATVFGDLTGARTIDLGAANFDGRRYDITGGNDNLGAQNGVGSTGTLIFNDPNTGTATLASNITFTQSFEGTTNPGGAELMNNGQKVIVINGNLTAGSNGARNWILDGTNTGANTINGIISNGGGTAVISILKEGPGTWRLGGNNTFTGGVNIARGVLEIINGNTIGDAAVVNLSNAGSDGSSVGAATLRVLTSEIIGGLTGAIGTEVSIASGQTLTIANAEQTFNGIISGAGGLTRTNNDATARFQNLTNLNTYTGATKIITTGTATGNRLVVSYLANGGQPSGIGASSNDAANLVIDTNTGGGGLRWIGLNSQTTDRLFTIGNGASAAAIWADGTVTGDKVPTLKFTNTGNLAYLTANANSTLILRGANKGDNGFDLSVGNNGTGVVSLTKMDAGTWVLGGNSTFTGAVNVMQGTLGVTSNTALGTAAGGVIVSLAGSDSVSYLDLRNVTISGEALTLSGGSNNNFFGVATSIGNSAWTGTVANNASAIYNIAANASLTLSGVVSGGGAFTKIGNGTLKLAGANTITGAFNARGGTVILDYTTNSSKLGDAAVLTLGSGTGVSYFRVNGTNYRGQEPLLSGSGTNVVLTGGDHTEIVGSTTIDAGANYIGRSSGTAKINLNAINRAALSGGTLDVGVGVATTDNATAAGAILGGYLTFNKTDWAISAVTAADTVITALLSGSYTASDSAASWVTGSNINFSGAPSLSAAVTVNSLRFNEASAKTLTLVGANNTINTGGILVTPAVGANNILITGIGTLTVGSAANELIVHQFNPLGQVTIATQIVNNGATVIGLTKSGSGPLILAADNLYSGTTSINEGTVRVGTGSSVGQLGNGAGQIVLNGTLSFNSTHSLLFNQTGTLRGNGNFILESTNTRTIVLTADNTTFTGNFTVNGGTLALTNGNAMGNTRMQATVNSGGTVDFRNVASGSNFVLNGSGRLMSSTGGSSGINGAIFISDGAASAFDVANGSTLTLSNWIYTTTGLTKVGNGLLQINSNQMQDILPGAAAGATTPNANPALAGKFYINQGEVRIGNPRALGATGVGNETIVTSNNSPTNLGATLDLRGQSLNYGDDPDATREIIVISGAGINNTGALRNTSGTGQFSALKLAGNATISGGGFSNGSRLDLSTYDVDPDTGSALNGAFTRVQPTIDGGGFDLTIVGSSTGGNVVLHQPTFAGPVNNGALNKILVREGNLRIEQDAAPLTDWAGIKSGNVTNGIEIGYNGSTNTDLTNAATGVAPNVGARLNFFRNVDIHHTVDIIMNGTMAEAAKGYNYIDIGTDTVSQVRTYLDGTILLMGNADRNIIHNDSSLNAITSVDQGNMTGVVQPKLIIGGVITGSGGFTKTGFRELRLTANNNFTGDLNILRGGSAAVPWQTNTMVVNGQEYKTYGDAEGWAEWGVTLAGTNAALSRVTNINLQRRGMLTLDNTTRLDLTSFASGSGQTGGNNNNRINDSANIIFNNGWLRINGGLVDNTEAIATTGNARVMLQSGTNILDLWPTDGAGTAMTLTIGQITRSAGAILRIQDLDSTSTFGIAGGANSVRVQLNSSSGLTQIGAGLKATDKKIVIGLLGGIMPHTYLDNIRTVGLNNANFSDYLNQGRNQQLITGSHFMTIDGGFLRPLDDSEYFVPGTGLIDTIGGAAGQNVNLLDNYTVVRENTSINSLRFGPLADSDNDTVAGGINSSTTLTSYSSVAAIQLLVDGTLTINSGMISSAWFSTGASSAQVTVIAGGNLNFGAREAIINNQNALMLLSQGVVQTSDLQIRSNIMGTGGLLKTGLAQVYLDGMNTYSGTTTINDGVLLLRNGRLSLGNSRLVVIDGNGNLNTVGGIQVGTAAAPVDILVKPLLGDLQVMRVNDDTTNWYANLIIDNVDLAGQPTFTPRVRTDNAATSIINGNVYGGSTSVSNDILAIDSRLVSFDTAGNNTFILRGQFGDRADANGRPIPIADPISSLPTLAGVRTNENEVLRVNLNGGNDESVFVFDRKSDGSSTQYNAAGRLTLVRGTMVVNYDPAAAGNDGTGFWTNTALSKIPGRDSTTTSFSVNGNTTHQGFQLGTGNGGYTGLFLAQANQVFNMASWNANSNNVKVIGGLNTSGTVTYGDGTGSLTMGSALTRLYAASGGTVVFNQRMTGSAGTAPNNLGFSKIGPGTVILQNTGLATAADSPFELAGGTLVLDHSGQNVARVGAGTAVLSGGTLQVQSSTTATSIVNLATNGAVDNNLQFRLGSSEVLAEARSGQNLVLMMGNTNPNGTATTANMTRALGATANLVEWVNGGNTAQIQLNFNAYSTAIAKSRAISWATYGNAPRTASDFAMVDAGSIPFAATVSSGNTTISGMASTTGLYVGMPIVGAGIPVGAFITSIASSTSIVISLAPTASSSSFTAVSSDVRAFGRAPEEYVNSVSGWAAGMDVSENGGNGFAGTLSASLSLNSLRFDAAADSLITIANGQTLTLAGDSVAGALLVSSNVGAANKTITGGTLTATTGSDLIFHHYGTGTLTIGSSLTGSGAVVVTGPDSTNPAYFGKTGTVKLTGTNNYTGRTIITGGVLEVASVNALGVDPATATTNGILTLNGGTFRYTGATASLGNRDLRFEGVGGVIEVVNPDTNLIVGNGVVGVQAQIASQDIYRGDLIKTGAGMLTLQGNNVITAGSTTLQNSLFQGLMDIRQGSLSIIVDVGEAAVGTTAMLGSNRSWADGTIFRPGTNFGAFLGNGNLSGDWNIEEYFTFEGNNTFTYGGLIDILANLAPATAGLDGQINLGSRRALNLNGPIKLMNDSNGKGTTFEVNIGGVLRLNNGSGYLSGSGDIIKDGQGQIEFRANNPEWTGNLVIKQGTVYAINQADMLGKGAKITLGDSERGGQAQLLIQNPDGVQNHIFEVNHNIEITYNPAQTKRLGIDNISNGDLVAYNGDITLNDNLIVFVRDAGISAGGEQAFLNFNGNFKDGLTTSGNIVFQANNDNVNNATSGRSVGYAVLNGNNSAWTGDVTVNANLSFDQDKTGVLRLGNSQALTAANDVTMNFNSILQAGGQTVTIGSLSTLGGTGAFHGDAGTVGNSGSGNFNGGSSEIIENASTVPAFLTIRQATPTNFEALWDAKFRDGTLNSQFFAPGANTLQPSASLSVIKDGPGWATMTLDNDYTGTTTVKGGILQVGRNGIGDTGAPNASGTLVLNGGTLAGTGIIQGGLTLQNVTASSGPQLPGGIIKPGDIGGAGLGTLTVNGNMIFASGTTALLQARVPTYNNPTVLDTADPLYAAWKNGTGGFSGVAADTFANALNEMVTSAQHDQVNVLGTLNWTFGSKVAISNEGYSPKAGDIFQFFNGGNIVGGINVGSALRTGSETDTDLDLFLLGGDFLWDTSLFNSHGILMVVSGVAPSNFPPIINAGPTTNRPSSEASPLTPGTSVTLSVVAVSNPSGNPLTYYWRRKATPTAEAVAVEGAIGSSYTFSADSSTKGIYDVVVSSSGGSVVSPTTVRVWVNDAPNIVTQPVATQTVNPGTNPSIRVVASEGSGVTYQWRKRVGETWVNVQNGPNVQGATSDLLTLIDATEADEGVYSVLVSSGGSSVSSANSTLIINNPVTNVVATRSPADTNVYEGDKIIFSVTADGTGPFTYKWYNNGFEQTSTGPTYTISSATLGTSVVTVKVGNIFNNGSLGNDPVLSNPVALNVLKARPEVTSSPVSKILQTGQSFLVEVTANGKNPLKYQWKRSGTKIAGANLPRYFVSSATVANGGAYTADVSNSAGTASPGAGTAQIIVVDNTPVILPVVGRTQTKAGGTATMTVNIGVDKTFAAAPSSLQYRWYKGSSLVVDSPLSGSRSIIGQGTKTLKITDVIPSDSAEYRCEVTVPSISSTAVVGGITELRVFTAKPVITLVGDALPDAIVGGTYSFKIPVKSDDDSDPANLLTTPTAYAATGLPPGLVVNKLTGYITGKPTAISKKAEGYRVTITATNSYGSDTKTNLLLDVTNLPLKIAGTYTGPVDRQASLNDNLGGRLDLVVTGTAAYTGKLTMGAVVYTLKGALDIDVDGVAAPKATIVIPRKGTTLMEPLVLTFNIDIENAVLTDGEITDGTYTTTFTGWRQIWTLAEPAARFAGLHTFMMDIPAAEAGDQSIPQGNGFGSFTVAAKDGKFTVAGKMADGETLTSASYVGPTGQVLVYKVLYTSTPKGSIAGHMLIDDHDSTDPKLNTIEAPPIEFTTVDPPEEPTDPEEPAAVEDPPVGGEEEPVDPPVDPEDPPAEPPAPVELPSYQLTWLRPADAKAAARTYKEGFGPLVLTPAGGFYAPPAAGFVVLNLPEFGADNAELLLSEGGLDLSASTSATEPVVLTVAKGNKVTVTTPSGNPMKVGVTPTAGTGAFKGTFALTDTVALAKPTVVKRTVAFQGVIIHDPADNKYRGYGYFLLPQLPTLTTPAAKTPILSGQAIFQPRE